MIRQAREAKGLTQEQLAEAVGVDQATISLLENDRIPSPGWQVYGRVCQVLGLDPYAAIPLRKAS